MKIKFLQENLKAILPVLQKAVSSKPQLAILSSFLVIAKDNEVEFFSTDLYLGVKAVMKASVEQEGKIVVNGDVFREFISSLPSGEVSMSVEDSTLTIKGGGSKTNIQLLQSDDYPDFPVIEGLEFKMDINHLKEIDKHVVFATSPDQNRPVLTTVLFNFSDKGLELVSTDGYRLSVLNLDNIMVEEPNKLLIPAKAIREILKIAVQQQVDNVVFTVSEELKQVLFKVDGIEFYIRLIEGEYPPYDKIIPSQFSYEYEIDGEELLSQLKRAQIFAKSSSNIVRLKFEGSSLFINASSPSVGEFQGEITVKFLNNDEKSSSPINEIAFNSLYLIDFLSTIKPDRVWFGMNESLKPAMFKIPDTNGYKYVVMPFRVNN